MNVNARTRLVPKWWGNVMVLVMSPPISGPKL